jgi:hypothetical protein
MHEPAAGVAEVAVDEDVGRCALASSASSQTDDALPGGEPVGLDDHAAAEAGERGAAPRPWSADRGGRRSARRRRPSRPSRTPSSPRARAAAGRARRPRSRRGAARRRRRATSGASGRRRRGRAQGAASETQARRRPRRDRVARAQARDAGLPGAQWSSPRPGLRRSACARACSRPPPPTISTRITACELTHPASGLLGHPCRDAPPHYRRCRVAPS